MSDGESLRRWTVCGRCHAVRGGPIGTVDGVTVWQRCDCVPAEGSPTQPKVGDFNTELELCRACGLVPLRSGSRWSVWFCEPCATQAKRLNERVGRCVVPIGRHSLMNGVTARGGSAEDMESFAGQLSTLFDAMAAIGPWARTVVRENIVAAGQPLDVDLELSTYLASVPASATSELRFAEMVAHLLSRRSRRGSDAHMTTAVLSSQPGDIMACMPRPDGSPRLLRGPPSSAGLGCARGPGGQRR